MRFWFPTALAVLLLAGFPALAKEKTLGAFGNWSAYAYDEGGQTVCYMVTTKTVRSVGPPKRTAPYLMITHRPVEGSTDVVSYGAGAMLDSKRGVMVTVGKATFDLFSVRDIAWARDAQIDHKLAAALRNAATAQAKAASAKHGVKNIDDVFDLNGAAVAYRAIGKACGLTTQEAPRKPAAKKQPVAKKKH